MSAPKQDQGCTLNVYAKTVGLPVEHLEAAGVKQVKRTGQPAVAVTHYNRDGLDVGKSICRTMPSTNTNGTWDHKSAELPFGIHTINDQEPVYLVSSIVEAQTMHFHRLPAIAVSDTLPADTTVAALVAAPSVVVVVHANEDGIAVPTGMDDAPWRDRALLLAVPDSRWLNSLHQADQMVFSTVIAQMTSAAISWREHEDRLAEIERKVALEQCRNLVRETDIFTRVEMDAHRTGYAGDTRTIQLVFLSIISCLLERPVSIAVKAVSSAGKSFAVTTALKFVPSAAFYTLTSMSERALIYDDEPLRHRALVLYEADGLGGFAEVIVRSLLSARTTSSTRPFRRLKANWLP